MSNSDRRWQWQQFHDDCMALLRQKEEEQSLLQLDQDKRIPVLPEAWDLVNVGTEESDGCWG